MSSKYVVVNSINLGIFFSVFSKVFINIHGYAN